MRLRSTFEGVSTRFGIWATKRCKVLRRRTLGNEMFRFYVRPTIPNVRLGGVNLMALLNDHVERYFPNAHEDHEIDLNRLFVRGYRSQP